MMKRALLLFLGVSLFTTAHSQWIQFGQELAGEYLDDDFGYDVDLNSTGDILAVGGPYNEGAFNNAGFARVFRYVDGLWDQIGDDIDGIAQGDNLGYSLSLSGDGNTLALSSHMHSGIANQAGLVQVYKNIDDQWMPIGNPIKSSEVSAHLGMDISLSSDGLRLAVASPHSDRNFINNGLVNVYQLIDSNWVVIGDTLYGQTDFARYGNSVSLSGDGNTLAIGSPGHAIDSVGKGIAQVYQLLGGNWVQFGDDIIGESEYGNTGESVSLSLDGQHLAVGSSNESVDSVRVGVVRVYELNGTSLEQKGSPLKGIYQFEHFGKSVGLSGDGSKLVVGVPDGFTSLNGHVAVYNYNMTEWEQEGADIFIADGFALGKNVTMNENGTIFASGASSIAGKVRVYTTLPNFSLDNVENNSQLYPNPTSGKIYSNQLDLEFVKAVKVYNTLGEMVIYKSNLPQGTHQEIIDLSSLVDGVYTLAIESKDGHSQVQKVILSH